MADHRCPARNSAPPGGVETLPPVPSPNALVFQFVAFLLPILHIIILLTIISLLLHPPSEAVLVASPLLSKEELRLRPHNVPRLTRRARAMCWICLRALLPPAARSVASRSLGRIIPALIGGMHVQQGHYASSTTGNRQSRSHCRSHYGTTDRFSRAPALPRTRRNTWSRARRLAASRTRTQSRRGQTARCAKAIPLIHGAAPRILAPPGDV